MRCDEKKKNYYWLDSHSLSSRREICGGGNVQSGFSLLALATLIGPFMSIGGGIDRIDLERRNFEAFRVGPPKL